MILIKGIASMVLGTVLGYMVFIFGYALIGGSLS